MAFTFTSTDCKTAASSLNDSVTHVGEMITKLEDLIYSVAKNYESEASRDIVASFNKVKEHGPEFQQAVAQCSKYLVETVAPAYEKLESTAQSKIGI